MSMTSPQAEPVIASEFAPAAGRSVRPVAVVDIGATSIRMAIAEIAPDGAIRTLETLTQAVNLGRNTFTRGSIARSTIEECVHVLKTYRRVLEQYNIVRGDQIRVVATSAVREAQNRLKFLDRIYAATGLEVDAIDEAEIGRLTYFAIEASLTQNENLAKGAVVALEVGGGSTEVLFIDKGTVTFAHTYRLGSIRLREMLEAYRMPVQQSRSIMIGQIRRTIEQLKHHLQTRSPLVLLALGGDVRFAASELLPEWNRQEAARLELASLTKFADEALALSEDELVQKHHLSFPDAETLSPALLTYVEVARSLGLDHLLVANATLRDGLLREMSSKGEWSAEFTRQIVQAALELGRKFQFDEAHGRHVADLCRHLFRELRAEHRLDARYEQILYLAALLHEIGQYVGMSSHHKHSMYLILNSNLFGLSKLDLLLVALVARYHRRASPKSIHEGYANLDRSHRVAVTRMSAVLRLADALDRSHSQRVTDVRCQIDDGRLVIAIPKVDDLSLEQLAVMQKGPLFEETFGMQVLLRASRR